MKEPGVDGVGAAITYGASPKVAVLLDQLRGGVAAWLFLRGNNPFA